MSDDETNRWTAAVPLALLVVGLCSLQGCIILPGSGETSDGIDPSTLIGEGNDAPLQVGRNDRQDVDRSFANDRPNYLDLLSRDGTAKAYGMRIQTGRVIFDPFCFSGDPFDGIPAGYSTRYLVVRFDEAGVIRGAKLVSSEKAASEYAGQPLLRPYQLEQERRAATPDAAAPAGGSQ